MTDAAGPGDQRRQLVQEFEAARAAEDVEAMAAAARRLAADRRFGAPTAATGHLYEAYERAVAEGRDQLRVVLAVELARAWAYANELERATPFARDALEVSDRLGDPTVLAAALDADLLTHWGPDDLQARVLASSRLEGIAGRLSDVESRLSAALWRLTTALETLDVVAVRRQLRLLDDLARESGSARVRMFSASRHGMHALLTDDLLAAGGFLEQVRAAARNSAEPDGEALVHVLTSGIARQAGDVGTLAREAAAYQRFAIEQGIRSVLAEAAALWLDAGRPAHARDLLEQVVPDGVAALPRDVDWLLTVVSATEVAARVGALDVVRDAVEQLEPYVGRGVVNAGGVAFVGVVDGVLAAAWAALGEQERATRHVATAAAGYRRVGARWLARRLQERVPATIEAAPVAPAGIATASAGPRIVLAPAGDDVWLVGAEERPTPVKAAKGLRYLRLLLARPGMSLTALELAAAVNGTPSGYAQTDLGEVVDRRALAEYRRRLADIGGEFDRARRSADVAAEERLSTEREFLLAEIAAATGLRGRPRRVGGDTERARVAVQKAIVAAIRRIHDTDAAIGRLLQDTIRTGHSCSYQPDPARPVSWILDGQSTTRDRPRGS